MDKHMPSHLQNEITSIHPTSSRTISLPNTRRTCARAMPMSDRATNNIILSSLSDTDTPPHKVVTPRVRPEPRDPCTVRIQGVESWSVELHPSSLSFQAIPQEGV